MMRGWILAFLVAAAMVIAWQGESSRQHQITDADARVEALASRVAQLEGERSVSANGT